MESIGSIIGKIASQVAAKAPETEQKNANHKIGEETQNKKAKTAEEDALTEMEIENLDLNDDVETTENKGSSNKLYSQYKYMYEAEISSLKEQLEQYSEGSIEYANIMEKIATLSEASHKQFEGMQEYYDTVDSAHFSN